jgi:hypothetical protein
MDDPPGVSIYPARVCLDVNVDTEEEAIESVKKYFEMVRNRI